MKQVELNSSLPGGTSACLREMCGHDERRIAGTTHTIATQLLDRLLVEVPGTSIGPGMAWSLPLTDHDRLLAAIYSQHFGDGIECQVHCHACDKDFGISFALAELQKSQSVDAERIEDADIGNLAGPDTEGYFQLEDGTRFRLPNAVDRAHASAANSEHRASTLMDACLAPDGPAEIDIELVARAMEAVGPLVDTDISSTCPNCGAHTETRFEISSFLLKTIERENRLLDREIHLIATTYGWCLEEILDLSRSSRHNFVRMIQSDRQAARSA